MTSGADLFVVCKQCGSEVSPYITECPYCGNRLRRRAPKLPRAHAPARTRRGRLRLPSPFGRFKARRLRPAGARRLRHRAGSWAATRPYATITLVAIGIAIWVAARAEPLLNAKLAIIGPLNGDWWKLFTSQFVYGNGIYAFVALLAIAIFGSLVERRNGPAVVLALFLGAGVTGALVAIAVYPVPVVSGGNSGALALIAAWAAPDLSSARRHSYYEGDLLGAGAFAALLLAIPFARPEVSWLAGVTGALLGLAVGLGLAQFEEVGS